MKRTIINAEGYEINYLECEAIEKEAGLNSFVLTPKRWIEATQAIGVF